MAGDEAAIQEEERRREKRIADAMIALSTQRASSRLIAERLGSACLDDPEWNASVDKEIPLAAELVDALVDEYGVEEIT